MADLSVNIAGVELKNPVTTGSGTFGFGEEYAEYFDLSELGAVCLKALSAVPRQGNPSPRIAETPMGILNSVGLQNPGVGYLSTIICRSLKSMTQGLLQTFAEARLTIM